MPGNPLCGHAEFAFWNHWLGGGPRFASSLDALQLSFCSTCCVQGRNCNRECVFPKAQRAVCHSSAPQKELQGSPTAVCIPSVQRVALEMLERFFCYCFFKCVINGHLFVRVIVIMLTSFTKLFRMTVHRERISSLLFEHIQNFPHNLRVINGDNGM